MLQTIYSGLGLPPRFQLEVERLRRQITSNLISYIRQITDNQTTLGGNRVIFAPGLVNVTTSQVPQIEQASVSRGKYPSLSILIYFLNTLLPKYLASTQYLEVLLLKQSHKSSEDLNEIAMASIPSANEISPNQRLKLATNKLQELITETQQDISNIIYIIENTLLILWRHITYYLSDMPLPSPLQPDKLQIKNDAALRNILDQLTKHRSGSNFIQTLTKRLKELTRLN